MKGLVVFNGYKNSEIRISGNGVEGSEKGS